MGMKFCNPANPYGTERVIVCESADLYKKIKTATNDPSISKSMRRSQLLKNRIGVRNTQSAESSSIVNKAIVVSDFEVSTFIKIFAFITNITNNGMTINITGKFCYVNISYEDNGIKINLTNGSIYIMTEKATGNDWK